MAVLLIGSGNRDERQYPNPDAFDIARPDVQKTHLAFSGGQHGCAGQVLARAQGDVAIARLLQRFPDAHINGDVVYEHTEFIRGIKHLPVNLH